MTAAYAIAEEGYPVHLVEKETTFGGMARDVYTTLDGGNVQAFLADLIERVTSHPRITVHLGSKVAKVDGHVGDFASIIVKNEKTEEIEHGVVILATGATELKPHSFGYGSSDKVMTQLELSGRLARKEINLPEKASPTRRRHPPQKPWGPPHHRHDPMRGATKHRPPVLQQSLLYYRGQERIAVAGALSQGAYRGFVPRDADVRVSRSGLQGSAR